MNEYNDSIYDDELYLSVKKYVNYAQSFINNEKMLIDLFDKINNINYIIIL